MKTYRSIMIVFLLVISACHCDASLDEWYWIFTATPNAYQIASTGGAFGVSSSSVDDIDSGDLKIDLGARAYLGTYYVNGVDGWTGDTGFYRREIRSPFPMEPGQSRSWTFYVWADPTLGPAATHMDLRWFTNADIMPPMGVGVSLKLLSKPTDITGGPAVGTTYNLRQLRNDSITLPVYRTSNGLEGYKFELTATVVPEPSSLLALAGGLVGVGGAFLRRRKI